MTRYLKTAPALVVLTLLTAACGGGSSAAKDVAPTKAAATSAGKAINLVTADLPGYKSTPADNSDSSTSAEDKKVQLALAKCIGADASVFGTDDIVDLNSDDFSKGQPPSGVQVSSEVEVVPNLKAAKAGAKAFASDKAPTCLQTVFVDQFKKEVASEPGVTVGTPKVSKVNGPSGTDGSFGFTIAISITAQGLSIPVNLSIVGFLVKHSEVTLTTTSFGPALDSSLQSGLVAKLVERAKKSAV